MARLWIWDLFSKDCWEYRAWGSHCSWVVSKCLLASCVKVRALVRLQTKTAKWVTDSLPNTRKSSGAVCPKSARASIAYLMVWKVQFVALGTAVLGSWLHLEHCRGACEQEGLAEGQPCCSRCGGSSTLPPGSHRCTMDVPGWASGQVLAQTVESVLIQMLKSLFELKSLA